MCELVDAAVDGSLLVSKAGSVIETDPALAPTINEVAVVT